MKKTLLIASVAAIVWAGGFAMGCRALAQPALISDPEVAPFYEALRPYGEWAWHGGWCWIPYDIPIDWRPYTVGHWASTDAGFAWVSDEPWGWACYHYGRWDFDDDWGWCWHPGLDWAPAWVVWRTGDDWIGWAPCPSRLVWHEDVGFITTGIDWDDICPPSSFIFCRDRDFLSINIRLRVEHPFRNRTFFRRTSIAIGCRPERGRIVNHPGIHDRLEKVLGRRIERAKLEFADTIDAEVKEPTKGELRLFRPRRAERGERVEFRRPPEGRDDDEKLPARLEEERQNLGRRQAEEERKVREEYEQRVNRAPAAEREQVRKKQQEEIERLKTRQEDEQYRVERRQAEQREQAERATRLRELKRQQEEQNKALRERQTEERRSLEERQRTESERPPQGVRREQLRQQQQDERRALEEQTNRERRLLERAQERERSFRSTPSAPPERRFRVPDRPGGRTGDGGDRGDGRRGGEDRDRDGGRRR